MAVTVETYPVLRELPNSYYPVIGRIMVEWSYLENILRDCAYMLLRVSRKQGRIAVRSPRSNEVVTMIEDLMDLHNLSTRVNTRELKKALTKVNSARDALAHGLWVDHEGTDTPVLQIVSGSYPIEPGEPAVKARISPIAMETTPEELERTVHDIRRLTEAAEFLRADLEAKGLPSPDTPQSQ